MRPRSTARTVHLVAVTVALVTGCSDDASRITAPPHPNGDLRSAPAGTAGAHVVHVADVEQLYAAVNDPGNVGAALLLAPGTYVLSAADGSGASRPNAGRLELQRDMSVSGSPGDRTAVIVDASRLTASSFAVSFGRTGIFRTGHGRNAVEWLTIHGNPLAAAAVETDLVSTAEAWVRVAHVVAGNSARGVDVRNVGAAMSGRRLHAEIVDGEFFRGVEGIRVANFIAAHGGDIRVAMSGNRAYENHLGCIVENNRSNYARIHVRSSGDRFEDNGLGCQIGSGFVASAGEANFNSTVFECHGSHFTDNTRTSFFNSTGPAFSDVGGVLVVGGDSYLSGVASITSGNTAVMRLWGCKVHGNQHSDFEAYGARSADPSRIAGVDNRTTIELHGVSKRIDVLSVDSAPLDPSGSNVATVIR